MGKNTDRIVYKREDGAWANKLNAAERAASLHKTQNEAIRAAHQMLQNQGGGELTVKGMNGLIRSKDTIAPGNDPGSIHDTEH